MTPDSLIRLSLSNSLGLPNQDYFDFSSSAEIELTENGKLISDYHFDESTYETPQYIFNQKPCLGCAYTIKIKDDDFETIEAQTNIPNKDFTWSAEIISQDSFNFRDQFEEIKIFEFESMISSPLFEEDEASFFHLKIWKESMRQIYNGYTVEQQRYLEELDFEVVENIQNLNLFHESGVLFNGKDLKGLTNGLRINFDLHYYLEDELKTPIFIELRVVNEDYFRFHKSLAEQEREDLNSQILSNQDIPIYNNIKNGLGNFSGYLTSPKEVIWY